MNGEYDPGVAQSIHHDGINDKVIGDGVEIKK
jgi:hypothetical protein